MNVSNLSSYLSICTHTPLYPKTHAQFNSIPICNDQIQNNNNYTYSENNISCCKKSSSNIENSYFNKQSFSNNSENQNKSAYSNYVNLNKSQYYINGNEIGNFTSYKINNYNSSIFINNNNNHNNTFNSKDNKYIVQIRLSSNKRSHPDILNYKKSYNTIKNNNSFINKYSNNIENNTKNIINDKNRYRHYSYRNLTIPNKLDYYHKEPRNHYCSFKSYKDIKNIKKEIITEKIYVRENRKTYNINNKINNNNGKLIDEQILDYLSKNINEKEYLIKKMNNQNVVFRKVNKDKVINLNNLNNYSYINNNYNYYCNNNEPNSTLYNLNKSISHKNSNINVNKALNQKRNTVSNTIYSNYLKKKMKNFENRRYPAKIDYSNENENIGNYFDPEPISYKENENNNSTRNYPLKKGSKKIIKIDYYNSNYYYYNDDNDDDDEDNNDDNDIYNEENNELSTEKYKIPIPNKMSLSKNNNLYRKKVRNTAGNIKRSCCNINDKYQYYDTDRTSSNNYTLNKSLKKKKYKNKIYKNKINKSTLNNNIPNNENVIQKGLNLFFSNENKNKIKSNKNILCTNNNFNINGNKDKKEKDRIIIIKKNTILKKNNSFNTNLKDNKIIKNLKKLQVSHNVINEQFNKEKYEQNNNENEIDYFSVQSLDDAKLMELANNYINDEEINKEVIREILNSKKENKE